jgi:polyketide cyclase/dehydrase/lipid transport protein
MASIRKEVLIHAAPDDVWAALSDWGALHERLVPGYVTATTLDGPVRVVTFFNGTVLRELFVARDDETRRLVWSIVDGPYTHHNAAAQVVPAPGGATRFVWTADLLPDGTADRTAQMMERGITTAKRTLEAGTLRRWR